jgi:glucose uptake protein
VAAIWGIYIWKEFKNAPAGTGKLLKAMLLLFSWPGLNYYFPDN